MKRDNNSCGLPNCATKYIEQVVRKVRYRKKIRTDVRAELSCHFQDALNDCKTEDDRQNAAKELITEFGSPKILAKLIRRGKKRCRPLWKKVLIRTFQIFLLLVAFLVFRGLTLTLGSPTISTDYVQWLNELVQAGRDQSQNAAPHYAKAIELMSEEVPEIIKVTMPSLPENMSPDDEKIIADFLKANEPAFDELILGTKKPHYWLDYTSAPHETEAPDWVAESMPFAMAAEVVGTAMPNFRGYKTLARRLGLRCNWRMHNDDFTGALDDAVAINRLGGQMLGQGLLIEQLVGTAIYAMASEQIRIVINAGQFDTAELKALQQQIENFGGQDNALITIDAEQAFMYDMIQRGFTDDGKGNGRVLRGGLVFAFNDLPSALKGFFLFDFPDRNHVVVQTENYYNQCKEIITTPPFEGNQPEVEKSLAFPLMLIAQAGVAENMRELSWRLITDRQALITIVSILRYQKENDSYPESLEQLVDSCHMRILPQDPFSGKPLVYKKTDDGFILYSFGLNMFDDSGDGIPGNRWRQEAKDAIFWPVN